MAPSLIDTGFGRAYLRAGKFIGTHMVLLAPLCVALGASFPWALAWATPAVELLFAFMTFQSSLGTTARSLVDVVRRPAHLLGCLAVLLVGMPLIGFAAGNLVLPGQRDIILGVVLEYCVPMGVTGLMWTDIYNGNKPLSIAVCIISTVLAPLTLPAMMQLLMGATVQLDVAGMMADLSIMVAIPALLGVACNDLSRGRANAKVAPWLSPLAKALLLLVLMTNSTRIADSVRNMTPTLWATAALMLVLGMSGYFLGYVAARLMHADVSDSFSMGVCSGCRNISSGAVLAAQYFPEVTMFPVLMGTLFQHVVASLYGWAVRRLEARNTPASASAPKGADEERAAARERDAAREQDAARERADARVLGPAGDPAGDGRAAQAAAGDSNSQNPR